MNITDTVRIFGIEPEAAMLSSSTKGSVKAPQAEKVQAATRIVKETRPDILSGGELRFDTAFVPGAAAVKTLDSDITGQADASTFPDL